jgi:hypothetical protein|uniref:Uncharacterized protein n=1 Tax=Fagus sylvatica TaxID=28930 RepID=A0A2N9GDA0_FAGSY
MLSLSQLSPSRFGGGYGILAWYRSRRANLETHLGSRWLRLTSSGLEVVTIGVVLRWWQWASIGSKLCIHSASSLLVVTIGVVFVGGCGFVGAAALDGLVLMVMDLLVR